MMQVQVHKCATIGCDNPVHPDGERVNRSWFCTPCKKGKVQFRMACLDCGAPITLLGFTGRRGRCAFCVQKRIKENNKTKYRNKYRFERAKPRNCKRCGFEIPFRGKYRHDICPTCEEAVRILYNENYCLYCNSKTNGNMYCSNNCRQKTMILVHGRKKTTPTVKKD